VTHGGRHAAHLAVTTLAEGEFDPCCRDVPALADRWVALGYDWLRVKDACRAGKRTSSLDDDTVGKLPHGVGRWQTLDLDVVDALVAQLGVVKPRGKRRLIA
jgi:hypothetical protein